MHYFHPAYQCFFGSTHVFTFGGSGPAITAHGSLDLKQEIQIKI
jgi:hypothetical protein